MTKKIQIIGNGPSAPLLYAPMKDAVRYTCNLPPFDVPDARATFMVDFKMMRALTEGSVIVPGDWILGMRPKKWCEGNSSFYLKHSKQIRGFYTELPKYAPDYTAFNCGHLATYYCAKQLQADEIHMYGFDSIFDFELRSCTDFYLASDRSEANNVRISNRWRPIWTDMFKEFSHVKFILYHKHTKSKTPLPKNVSVIIPK
jgi:hypothetical protein